MKKNKFGFTYPDLFKLAIERPLMAQLEITGNCNQECSFCFRNCTPRKRIKERSPKDWKNAIKKLYNLGVRQFYFSGGEIFLYPQIEELFNYTKSIGAEQIIVNTNGVVDITNKNLSNIDELVFSIHGLSQTHEFLTGLRGSFRRVVKSLRATVGKVPRVGINTVVTKENIRELSNIYDQFHRLPLAYHSFNLRIDRAGLETKETNELISEYLAFVKTIPKNRLKLRHGMQNILLDDACIFNSEVPLPHCAAGKYKIVVDFLGDTYPCRHFQTPEFYCGNVFMDELNTIWKSGKGFKLFRKLAQNQIYPTHCSGCLKRFKCLGGCLAWRVLDKKNKKYERDRRCVIGNAYTRG